MTRTRALLAAIAATIALSTTPAVPADAAAPNPYAWWACGATRQSEEHTLLSATPLSIGSNGTVSWIKASCTSRAEDMFCSWIATWWSDGRRRAESVHCWII